MAKRSSRPDKSVARLAPPRNPFALLARQRVAGSHRKSLAAWRQAARREICKKLNDTETN